jgi:Domain of unknown function (DUF4276)
MKIQPIVEGHDEVGAVPVLIRRLRNEAQAYNLEVNQPIRKRRPELIDETQLRKAVRLAWKQEGCAAILILFDSDDDCPRDKGPEVQAWARDEAGELPCVVVLAHREFEAGFLAAIESLRGTRGIRADAESHHDPESPRDAKGELERRLVEWLSYSETGDQPALTATFNLASAHRSCRSFRRMVTAFSELVVALGETLPTPWPPADWLDAEA